MRVLVLGAGGMAGHVLVEYLATHGHEVESVARRSAPSGPTHLLDVKDLRALDHLVGTGGYDVVVNAIGLLIEAADASPADAALVNAHLPHRLAELLTDTPTRLVHLSTDCVFSGANGPYSVSDPYDGQRVYDRSKALGEVSNGKDLTIRTSIIGPELSATGTGLFAWFARQRGPVQGYSRALWTGVTTVELARVVEAVLREPVPPTGLRHVVPDDHVSKLRLLHLMDRTFQAGLEIAAVERPVLDKRLLLGSGAGPLQARGYGTMLGQMRDWIRERPHLYPHYMHLFQGGATT